ncbi:RNA-binding domain-containing protein [Succinimonas sp.]|uniref:RNA-binding domain-containing protein n=1 Tax=Succinimonas sp. TaxID=1936151 RepID=UPI00386BAB98
MTIPINIEKILNGYAGRNADGNAVSHDRIEFLEGWDPDDALKTISAFANDIDNRSGGYLVIGVREEKGRAVRPVSGLPKDQLDAIQEDILRCCGLLQPVYLPEIQQAAIDGKQILIIWCPGGYERPYQCPKRPSAPSQENREMVYYIRRMAGTIEAMEPDVKELLSLSHNVPFDDRMNPRAEIRDLKYPLLRNYLKNTESSLLESAHGGDNLTVEAIAADLRIAYGPRECYKPLNVGLLFFNDNPEKFFPYTRIEIVDIPDETGQGMEERILSGPIDEQLRSALSYLKKHVIAEKVFKLPDQAEAVRIKNYSYTALKEFVSNAVFHRSYQEYEPVTIRIERDKIEITSVPGPDSSISDEDIRNYQMRARRYRNRRIGDFLKELQMAEGRNTGIPRAIKAIKANGSPLPMFLTDEDRTFFSVIVPIHPVFADNAV